MKRWACLLVAKQLLRLEKIQTIIRLSTEAELCKIPFPNRFVRWKGSEWSLKILRKTEYINITILKSLEAKCTQKTENIDESEDNKLDNILVVLST